MQELEKILEEIEHQERICLEIDNSDEFNAGAIDMAISIKDIIRKYMENDGWISVEERLPEKEYSTVLCVTDKNYYFVGVYNRKKRFRTGDIYAEGKVIAWMPLEPYRPERSEGE